MTHKWCKSPSTETKQDLERLTAEIHEAVEPFDEPLRWTLSGINTEYNQGMTDSDENEKSLWDLDNESKR